MARQRPIELFMPPNMLKAKVGGGFGGIDMGAIKRAEKAMEALKGEFHGWADQDVKRLVEARDRFAKEKSPESRRKLLRVTHDITGQAATFGFPLIARVAESLSKLLGETPADKDLPPGLIDAHVGAVQVIFRENITNEKSEIARLLCEELDARVTEALAEK